jgi:hypothetical protein
MQVRGRLGCTCGQPIGHPRRGGDLPVIERHVVDGEGQQTGDHGGRKVPGFRQTEAGERGDDGERRRGHEHTQEGKRTRGVRSKGVSYCSIGGGAEHDGGHKRDVWEAPHAPIIADFRHGEVDQKAACRYRARPVLYSTLKVHPTVDDNPREDRAGRCRRGRQAKDKRMDG